MQSTTIKAEGALITDVISRDYPSWAPPAPTGDTWVRCQCPVTPECGPVAAVSFEHNGLICMSCSSRIPAAPRAPQLSVEIPHWLYAFTRAADEIVVYRSLQMRETSTRFEPVRRFLESQDVRLVYRDIIEDDDMFLCRAELSIYRISG